MRNLYSQHQVIYTDGSLQEDKTGCAIIFQNRPYLYRLPNNTSIYTAELFAILKSLSLISTSPAQDFLICSDSYSALQTIKSGKLNALTSQIFSLYTNMPNPKSITLEWIPSHKNIPGNELADKMAKQSLNLNIITHIPQKHMK